MKKSIAAACLALAIGALAMPDMAKADHKSPAWSDPNLYGMPWNQPRPGWNGWNQLQPGWNSWKQPQFGWNGGWGQPWGPSWNSNRCWGSTDWRCGGPGWKNDHDRFVSPKTVARQIKAYGFRKVIDIDRDGGYYRVKAIDDRGRLVGMLFDAESGRLIKKKFVRD